MSMTEEIAERVKAGDKPADIIAQGYKRTLVYKVNKALQATPSGNGHCSHGKLLAETSVPSTTDNGGLDIDADPEIIALKNIAAIAKALDVPLPELFLFPEPSLELSGDKTRPVAAH